MYRSHAEVGPPAQYRFGVGQVLVLIEMYVWEAFGEGAEKTPIGGRLFAIQQPGFGQPKHPGGLGTQDGAAGVLRAQPGKNLRVALAECVEIVPEGGQYDDVGVFEGAVDRQHHIAEA